MPDPSSLDPNGTAVRSDRSEDVTRPPIPERRPVELRAHGDVRIDDWYWLRDKEDPRVIDHLNAENRYTEASTSRLAPLREGLFEEIRSRVLETDLSVPVRRGPWWYYGRTEEGKSYGIHCRRPARLLVPGMSVEAEVDLR